MMAGPTPAPEIHICLVSDQLLPNVIPVLARQPRAVHLVVSSPMRSQGERLARVLGARAFEVRVHDQAPDTGLKDIARYASRLARALQAAGMGERLILNATGGTKPMAMVFVDVFRGVAAEILYTDTAHGRLEFIECKTLRLDRGEKEEHASLYKLDSLSEDMKGLFGQTLLISARPPTSLMRDRASHLGVRILGPRDLPMLGAHIHRWLNDV